MLLHFRNKFDSKLPIGNISMTLIAIFFENGPISTPTKFRNLTIAGSGDPDSVQWSHPSKAPMAKPNHCWFRGSG